MTSGEKRREIIYGRFSNNLSEVLHSIGAKCNRDDAYICPICLKVFTRDALNRNIYDDELTLEDAPPRHLSGKKIVLTCKICNNDTGGNTIDHHLGKKLLFDEFSDRNAKVKALFEFDDDISIKGKIESSRDKGVKLILNNESNPYRLPDLMKLFEANKEINFKVSIQPPDIRMAAIAALKSAYLMAFAKFGYGFLLNKDVEKLSAGEYFRSDILKILDQIKHPSKDILPNFGVVRDKFPDEFLGINFVSHPEKFRSILVVFDIVSKKNNRQKQRLGVFLPAPISNGILLYSEIVKKIKKGEGIADLKIIGLKDHFNLNESSVLWINDIWESVMNA